MIRLFFIFLFVFSNAAMAADAPIEVTADNALEWNRDQKTFIAKGNALISQGESSINAPTITARYNEVDGNIIIDSVIASGNATLKQPNETLSAETVTAQFINGQLGTVEATNNVILKTDKETLMGSKGVYDAIKRVIIITGDVRIEQGDNILTGNRAEFDLNTNISKLSASPKTNGGRVKAVFQAKGAE